MWNWLLAVDFALLMILGVCAGWVAMFVHDEQRASRAYRVLKLTLGAMTGATGITALGMRLYELQAVDVAGICTRLMMSIT